MPFFISKLGFAFETCEGGVAKWNPRAKDFTSLMSPEEMDVALSTAVKCVKYEEARDFMLAQTAAMGEDQGEAPREASMCDRKRF